MAAVPSDLTSIYTSVVRSSECHQPRPSAAEWHALQAIAGVCGRSVHELVLSLALQAPIFATSCADAAGLIACASIGRRMAAKHPDDSLNTLPISVNEASGLCATFTTYPHVSLYYACAFAG